MATSWDFLTLEILKAPRVFQFKVMVQFERLRYTICVYPHETMHNVHKQLRSLTNKTLENQKEKHVIG